MTFTHLNVSNLWDVKIKRICVYRCPHTHTHTHTQIYYYYYYYTSLLRLFYYYNFYYYFVVVQAVWYTGAVTSSTRIVFRSLAFFLLNNHLMFNLFHCSDAWGINFCTFWHYSPVSCISTILFGATVAQSGYCLRYSLGSYYRQGQGLDFFSVTPRPDRLWSPASLLSNGYRGLFSGT
jgi:hypothetical protein